MQIVLALLPDGPAVRRLRCALQLCPAGGPAWKVWQVSDWTALHREAAETAAALAIADPYDPSGTLQLSAFASFRSAFPSTPLLPYGDFHGRVRDAMRLSAVGMAEIVVRDQDDSPSAFAAVITALTAQPVAQAVLAEIEGMIPPRLAGVVTALLSTAGATDPGQVARMYSRHRNTLREHLRAAGLPPVNKLIVWTRLFRAAHLLGDPSRTVEGVALALDFPSPSALRNQLQRYAGLTPQQVQARGLAALAERFRQRHRAGAWDVDSIPLTAHEAPQSNAFVRERVCIAA